jgi:hypothetical protein
LALASLKLSRTLPSNEAEQSKRDAPVPANLDNAFLEITERFEFDWPENLAVTRVPVGIGEIGATAFVFAGLATLARHTI